jgi:hypothetical protein
MDDLTVTTGNSDLVSYTEQTLTIYVYPVIGRTVYPSSNSTCADHEKVPLTVNFAGPDTVRPNSLADGNVLPWYQPPWMPGNVLSYPGHVAQLQAAAFKDPNDFQQLSQPGRWGTGSGTDNARATWTAGSSTGITVGSTQNYSFETDISASGKFGLAGLSDTFVGVELDLSDSFSNLTDTTTTLAKSQDIEFKRTATFEKPTYEYFVWPYAFGKRQPEGVVDHKPLSTDIRTFSALRTAHVVDIPREGCCGYWTAWYGQAPDVGLNQPVHWVVARSQLRRPRRPATRQPPGGDLEQRVSLDARVVHHRAVGLGATAPDGDHGRPAPAAGTGVQPEPGGDTGRHQGACALHGHAMAHRHQHAGRPELPDRRTTIRRSDPALQLGYGAPQLAAGAAAL